MLYILDRNEQVVGLLQSNSDRNKNIYYDDVLTEILSSGADTFTFTSIPDKETSEKLTVGNYIAFKKDNKFKLLQIIEVNENKEDVLTKEVYCEGAGLELINTVYSGSKMDAVNVERFLKNILQDTNWKVGHVSSNLTKTLSLDVKEKEVYSIIQEYLYDFEAEIDFRVEIKGNRIVGRYIDVYSKRGRNNGRRLEINRDIKGITRKVSLANYATKLIGEGKNGLNFRDISMTGTIEKPLGQNFVVNEEAYSRLNNKGKHITRKFTYDTEDAYELLRQTHKALKEYSEPKVTYEVDVDILDFDDIEIGDYVSISDLSFTPPLLVTARISELETSKTNKYSNKAVLSNFNEVRSGISSIFPILGEDIVSGSIGGEQMNPDYVDSIISDSVDATMVKTEILLADKANIKDLDVTNANIENLKANVAEIDELLAGNITADNIQADSITSNHIQANSIDTKHLKANSIDADKIQANSIVSNHIQANSVTSNHIQANTITSGHIQAGTITAGSGIIADGAIGNAQISRIDAGKIEAGTIDTSKVTIQGANGHLRLKGNRMQVFQGTGNQAKERVSVGDVNGNGTVYGLRVRGADGQTILLDENGVKSEGITDGAITNDKISDNAEIDGAKLNINSVVSKINEDGTETIQGTKIEVNGTTLNTKLSTITNKQTEDSERITQAQSQITANTNAIKLKVDEQIYTSDKKNMTSKLEKNTSEISAMKGQIALKVEQTDIENAKNEINNSVDTKIASAKSEIKVTTDGISQSVGKLETTTTELAGKVTNQETRLSSAEQKITDKAITSVVQESQFIKDMDGKISTNKSSISKVEQTANSISSKVSDLSGKYTEIKQTVDSIDLTGKVSFSDLSTSGRTTINGANITTGTIDTNRVNIKGGTTKKIVIANDNYCVYDGTETDVNRKVFIGFRTNVSTNVPSVMLGYNGINPSVDGAVVSGGTYTTYSHYPNNNNPESINQSYGALAFKYGAGATQFSTLNMYQNGDIDLKAGKSIYFRPNLRAKDNHVFAISDTEVGSRVPFKCTSTIYSNGDITTDRSIHAYGNISASGSMSCGTMLPSNISIGSDLSINSNGVYTTGHITGNMVKTDSYRFTNNHIAFGKNAYNNNMMNGCHWDWQYHNLVNVKVYPVSLSLPTIDEPTIQTVSKTHKDTLSQIKFPEVRELSVEESAPSIDISDVTNKEEITTNGDVDLIKLVYLLIKNVQNLKQENEELLEIVNTII